MPVRFIPRGTAKKAESRASQPLVRKDSPVPSKDVLPKAPSRLVKVLG